MGVIDVHPKEKSHGVFDYLHFSITHPRHFNLSLHTITLHLWCFTSQFPSTSSYSHFHIPLTSATHPFIFFIFYFFKKRKISPYHRFFLYFLLHFWIFFIIFSFYYLFSHFRSMSKFQIEKQISSQTYYWTSLRFKRFFRLDLGSSGSLILFTCSVLIYKNYFHERFMVNPIRSYDPIRI